AVSRVLTAPFDVAKIRFQLDHGATRRYRSSVWAAMRSIYGEEGLVTLWRGNLPAMFLWSAYSAVQFCAYEQLRTTDFLNSRRNSYNSSSSSSSSKGIHIDGSAKDDGDVGGAGISSSLRQGGAGEDERGHRRWQGHRQEQGGRNQ
ncbi:unnamed protein product, partial [Hapterophycus canaliculatus]